jgi:acyl-[acyl carrier protein]--UDP-N-acetylglucosamine O-acyltransferase
MVAVHQFVHVGSHVMIAGGSLVRKDVPPFIKAGREPLAYVGINSIGLRRAISAMKKSGRYRIFTAIYIKRA